MGEKNDARDAASHSAEDFTTFFSDKVDTVRQSTSATPLHRVMPTATHTLHQWDPVTLEDVIKLIGNAPNKHCQLDPAPTWLVKQHSRLLAPFIALLINKSLAGGCFPVQFKHAVVSPLIKKGSTDSSQLKSYRPVSNLPFLSKLLEKAFRHSYNASSL